MRVVYNAKKDGRLEDVPVPILFQLAGRFPNGGVFIAGSLEFKLTGSNIRFLKQELPDMTWEVEEATKLDAFENLGKQVQGLKYGNEVLAVDVNYDFKTNPYEHQLRAFNLSRDLKVFGFFLEMGCGKTKVSIDTMAYQYQNHSVHTVLILAPNGVHSQWVDEQLPDHNPIPEETVSEIFRSYLKAADKKRMKALLEMKPGTKLRVVSMNIEALSSESGLRFAQEFLATADPKNCAIYLDESSRIKRISATRTKNCMKLKPYAEWRRILSGTPVTKGVEDLYSQLKFLDDRILGFSSYVAFKAKYCIIESFDKYDKIVGYQYIDDIQKRLDGYTFRVRKIDCLDLPPKIYHKRYVELTDKQRSSYEKLVEELMLELDNGQIIEARLAIVRLLRLQQVLCGYVPTGEGEEVVELVEPDKNPRIIATKEIVEEADGKVIIWARFRKDIQDLEIALKEFNPVKYYGGMTSEQKDEAKRKFVKGDAKIFIGNPAAAGIGLNLTVADTVIYYSNSFDAEYRWQSEDRNHRIGQDKPVNYIDLIAKGTVDTRIISSLRQKQNIASMTIDQLRELLIQNN